MNTGINTSPGSGPGGLYMGRQSRTLRQALWGIIRELQRDDVLAPVTVVAPNRYASLNLRQDLGQTGFVNVRFIQLPVLAELLGAAALSAAKRRPLSAALESIFLRDALSQATDALSEVSRLPKTQASVKASFRELRRLDDAALATLERQGGVTGETVRLYRTYRDNISGDWFDAEDLTAAAARAVEGGEAFALADLGHIVFYLPGRASPAEIELMRALARQRVCSVVLGTTGDPLADGPALALAGSLERVMGAPVHVESQDAGTDILAGAAALHVDANTHEELRSVIRQILQEYRERGTPFHRMAVLYRMENPYGSLVQDELAMADIPLAGPSRATLAESPVGRALLGALNLPANDFRRDEVMAWLTGCPVRLTGRGPGGEPVASPSQWDALSRRAGVVGGIEQWRTRLAAYSFRMEDAASEGELTGEITEVRAAYMREEADSATRLLAFMEELDEAVTQPPSGSKWSAYCDWARSVLSSYLSTLAPADRPEVAERLERQMESIERALEELRSADNIRPPTSGDEFLRALADVLQAPAGHLGATGRGVFVSNFRTAIGMEFEVVWLVGMIEGGAPPAIRPDPLLPEGYDRSSLVSDRAERQAADERYAYLSAISSAPRRVLSYPVADSSSRREAHPSRWLLEQASALAGQQVHSRTLSSYASHPWLTINVSGRHALATATDDSLADTLDYNLHRLLSWSAAGKGTAEHPLAADGSLFRASKMRRQRSSAALTEYDGNLSSVAADARFRRSLTVSPISPTRLENWAACPFRYFLGYVLRLGALENPEDTATISPLERGSLIHKILERFVSGSFGSSDASEKNRERETEEQERLLQIAEEEFKEAEAKGVTGKPLLWKMEKLNIREDLLGFLREDRNLRRGEGILRSKVEVKFGYGGATPDVLDPETELRFRGSIDRLDVTRAPAHALVIDYKTGSSFPYRGLGDDPIDGGKRLQLGVYSLAATRLAPETSQVKAAYWFVTERGKFELLPGDFFEIDVEATGKRFREGVSTIVTGIQAGVFPANPGPVERFGPANCTYCEFNSLCPSRRVDSWETKSLDPVADVYRGLAPAQLSDTGETGEVQ